MIVKFKDNMRETEFNLLTFGESETSISVGMLKDSYSIQAEMVDQCIYDVTFYNYYEPICSYCYDKKDFDKLYDIVEVEG